MGNKMNTTRSLYIIAVNAIFAKVLQIESAPEAPGGQEQISFERGYKMFVERALDVMLN